MKIYVGRLTIRNNYNFFESAGIKSNAWDNEEIGNVVLLGEICNKWKEGDFLMIFVRQSLADLETNSYPGVARYRMYINKDRRINKIQVSDSITIEDGESREREGCFTFWGFGKTININNKSISFLTEGFKGFEISNDVKKYLFSAELSLSLVFNEFPHEHDNTQYAINNQTISKRTKFPTGTKTENKDLTVDIESLENRIAKFDYKNAMPNKEEVENGKFPMFANVFYNLLYQDSTIPDTKRVFEKYLSERDYFYKTDDGRWIVNYAKSIRFFPYDALEGRFYRAVSSLVRDYHFYCLALASNRFEGVKYSTYDDIYLKTDITVILNGKDYAIGLAQGTTESIDRIKQKVNRHDPNIKVVYCLLGTPEEAVGEKPRDANAAGRFFLYTMKHIDNLIRYISEQDDVLKNNCLLYPDGREEEF